MWNLALAALALAAPALAAPPRDGPYTALPHRAWDITHLHLAVRIDPAAGTVVGTTTHTVQPLGARDPWFVLHQRGLQVREIRVDGQPAARTHVDADTIRVWLPENRPSATVQVDYSATPEAGLYFRHPRHGDRIIEVWSQGEDEDHRYWFPSWDHPSDRFTFSADLTVPDGLTALSNGLNTAKKPADSGWTTWSWRLEQPLVNYLVAVTVGEYEVHAQKGNGPLETYVPKGTPVEAVRVSTGQTAAMMDWMADWTGLPFPYPAYRQVFVQRFLYSGMENTTLVVLSDHLLRTDADPEGRTEAVVMHELAHQWFGDWLTCYGWRELWLNEGFASLAEMRWAEHREGPEAVAGWVYDYRRWGLGDPDRPMAARSWSKHDDRANTGVYVRGASVLRHLEAHLGRPTFDRGVREYVRRHGDSLVESEDLRRVLEDVSGRPLGWIFDRIVTGTAFPAVTGGWTWADGQLVLTFEQTDRALPEAPVEVEVGAAGGVARHRIWLDEGKTRFVIPLEAAPLWVAVDPDATALIRWKLNQPDAAWAAQASQSPTPTARVAAFEALEDAASEHAVPALVAALFDTDRHAALRARAAGPLAKHNTPEAVDRLLAATANTQPSRVRVAATEALADVAGEAPVKARLRALTDDGDAGVRAAALPALNTHDKVAAQAVAKKWLATPDSTPARLLHAAALRVAVPAAPAKAFVGNLVWLDKKHPKHVRETAARQLEAALKAQVLATDPLAEKSRAALQNALLSWLDEVDIELRWLAVEALGRVGGPSAEPALRAVARGTAIPDLQSDAAAAAQAIRARGEALPFADAPELKPPAETDLDAVKDEVNRLEERLKRLEERP